MSPIYTFRKNQNILSVTERLYKGIMQFNYHTEGTKSVKLNSLCELCGKFVVKVWLI